jgi:hypothetical protein
MTTTRLLACCALTLVTVSARGDRLVYPGRIVTGPASVAADTPGPFGRFTLFGWVSPPPESTNDRRVAEMAALGLNLMLPALDDSGRVEENRRRLALARAHGMSCIVWDHRFQGLDSDSAHDVALIPPIVADYRGEPGLSAYYFGDEPKTVNFLALERFAARLRSFDPAHPIWNNLSGRAAFPTREAWLAHHRAYVARIHPAVLCNDQYDFLRGTDRGQFVENAAGLNAVAREAGIPFWGIIQLIEHGPFRSPTAGELRWQIGMLLAYGARGVGYFTYWTPRPDPRLNWQPAVLTLEGQRTAWYPVLARLGAYLRPLGEALAGMTWMATVHAGSVPLGGTAFVPDDWVRDVEGRIALGYFADAAGRHCLFVVNSDSLAARTITLTLPTTRAARVWTEGARSWDEVREIELGPDRRVAVPLEAGGFGLVLLEGHRASGIAGGVPPVLEVAPNPARDEVSLAVSRLGDLGAIQILDLQGRRVWSKRLAPGLTDVRWRGDRDAGGVAPPGAYFVRLEDARGFAIVHLTWLGR